MKPEVTPFERKANYYETDQMGVIHHSNYIRWFEETRVDFLEKVGYSYDRMEQNGVMIPVLGAACEYKNSVRFGDIVLIIPKIQEFNGFKLTVTYKVIRKSDNMLMATGETKHCFTNMQMKPVRTKKEYPEIFKTFNDFLGIDLY